MLTFKPYIAICSLMLFNAYIHCGMWVKLKVLELIHDDLIGSSHHIVGSVVIQQQKPLFTFLTALVCTPPELPLVSPLILWCAKHRECSLYCQV